MTRGASGGAKAQSAAGFEKMAGCGFASNPPYELVRATRYKLLRWAKTQVRRARRRTRRQR
jgi:hypothetical protein